METDKFEKHIKNQFKERKINPSEQAWETISSELNTTTSKKRPVFVWIGVAASVVVLMALSMFFFSANKKLNEILLKVVEKNNDAPAKEKEALKSPTFQEMVPEAIVATEVNKDNPKEVPSDVVTRRELHSVKENVGVEDQSEMAVVAKASSDGATDNIEISDAVINSKISEIVARIDDLERFNAVTDAEVDSLLKRAQDEILRDKIFNTDKSVNAMALLTEVEDELDQSFRDQIFNSLKAGFIKVRTAVADRNN
ncbi:MAG: hypothetical protein ABJM12_18620 [Ekhidna sp.]